MAGSAPLFPEKTPAVSVIMPAYRTTEYIAEALDSVLNQTFQDFEIIVVNDGCPDTVNLERVLAPYLPFIRYLKQENSGPSGARNAAIRAARAPIVALLDSDDAWEPGYLRVQVGMMRADPSIDVLYSDAVFFGDTPAAGSTFMELFPSGGEVAIRSLLLRQCCICNSASVARRETLLRAGLYNPDFRNGEDLDLWLRVLSVGGRIAYHRRPLCRYRSRPSSITGSSLEASRQLLRVLANARETLPLGEDDRRALDETIRRETAQLSRSTGKKAFFDGDVATAYASLAQANEYFGDLKIRVVLFLMRHCPHLLRKVAEHRYRRLPPEQRER